MQPIFACDKDLIAPRQLENDVVQVLFKVPSHVEEGCRSIHNLTRGGLSVHSWISTMGLSLSFCPFTWWLCKPSLIQICFHLHGHICLHQRCVLMHYPVGSKDVQYKHCGNEQTPVLATFRLPNFRIHYSSYISQVWLEKM